MPFISAVKIASLAPIPDENEPNGEHQESQESFQQCYDRCVESINTALTEAGNAGLTEYEYSFYEHLGRAYYRSYSSRLHDKVTSDLKSEGYHINYPQWSDSMYADGVIIISWKNTKSV